MRDPMTVAFEIRYPWRKYRHPKSNFEKGYRESFITIWHIDPEIDGTDNSCDWWGIKRNRSTGWYPATLDDYNQLSESSRNAVNFIWFNWIAKMQRPWYRHPRWHVWHWELQIHPWQTLRRWLFSRCAGCRKRFPWGYSPLSAGWNSPKTKWFRSEVGSYHDGCYPYSKR